MRNQRPIRRFAVVHAFGWAWPALTILATGCAVADVPLPKELPVETKVLGDLGQLRIYFGHQSVGENILDGVTRFVQGTERPSVRLIQTEDPSQLAPGVWAHSKIGENEAPASKVAHFDRVLRAGLAERADIAFMKFCYIDFDDPALNVDELFASYVETMDALKADYPELTLVHFTAPLTSVQTGAKAWLRKQVGKSVWGEEENVRRLVFNEKMRSHYDGKAPLFDVAHWEARRADDRAHTFEHVSEHGRRDVPALLPGFTDDGGHLNTLGRRYVAGALLRYLGGLHLPPRATERDSGPVAQP